MQVVVVVKCMETNSGGCGLSGFRVMASFCLPLKNGQNLFQTMDYSPWFVVHLQFSASPTHTLCIWAGFGAPMMYVLLCIYNVCVFPYLGKISFH